MKCPLCGGEDCYIKAESQSNKHSFKCKAYNKVFYLGSTIETGDDKKQKRLNNLIFEFLLNKPYFGELEKPWRFIYNPDYNLKENDDPQIVNLAELKYPDTLADKIDCILLNLYRIKPNYGEFFAIGFMSNRAFFAETDDNAEIIGLNSLLKELGYISSNKEGVFLISAKGWQRIEELLRKKSELKQAFIAMAFRDETKCIREAFKKGISNAGFRPVAIDEKEHNNQIVPEIFYEIDNSSFLVMDVTYPNHGAYYEAGYALGKGKQVIICCRKDSFEGNERPHFDIAQKSMIVWKDEEELVERLEKRIRATVG